jgi:hypothetical protein
MPAKPNAAAVKPIASLREPPRTAITAGGPANAAWSASTSPSRPASSRAGGSCGSVPAARRSHCAASVLTLSGCLPRRSDSQTCTSGTVSSQPCKRSALKTTTSRQTFSSLRSFAQSRALVNRRGVTNTKAVSAGVASLGSPVRFAKSSWALARASSLVPISHTEGPAGTQALPGPPSMTPSKPAATVASSDGMSRPVTPGVAANRRRTKCGSRPRASRRGAHWCRVRASTSSGFTLETLRQVVGFSHRE